MKMIPGKKNGTLVNGNAVPHNTSTKHCLLATSSPFPKSFIGNYTRDEVFNECASVKDIIAKKKKRKNGFPVVKIIATKAEHNKKKLIFPPTESSELKS